MGITLALTETTPQKKDNEIMNEQIRLGDVTGFDDAEIIDLDDDVYLVIDSDYDNTED